MSLIGNERVDEPIFAVHIELYVGTWVATVDKTMSEASVN